jgi:hypothetical protein
MWIVSNAVHDRQLAGETSSEGSWDGEGEKILNVRRDGPMTITTKMSRSLDAGLDDDEFLEFTKAERARVNAERGKR